MTAARMASMKSLSLFSGIGGLDLAAESCGIETAAFCEIEPYAVEVLKRRWPAIENHGDITRFTNRRLRELGGSPFLRFKCPADYDGTIDVVHGGFPCQDLSVAGKQAGLEGARSGLWFEMLRVISEIRPAFVLAENVRGAVNLALDTVYSNLVNQGYKVYPYVIPASAVGAPHQRERLFVFGVRRDVVHAFAERLQGSERASAFCEDGTPSSQPAAECGEGGGAFWPTPTSTERSGINPNTGRGAGLTHAVSLWPTPHRNCSNGAGAHGDGGLNIQTAVSLWPTPRANKIGGSTSEGYGLCLQEAVNGGRDTKLWRTPDAHCDRGPSSEERMKWKQENKMPVSINDQVQHEGKSKGQLNPAWVEILMGYPMGWADIDCDEPKPWPGWPALMGQEQYPYEPPRTVTGCPNRAKRLKCLGNAVVPAQARPFFEAMASIYSHQSYTGQYGNVSRETLRKGVPS